MIAQILTFIQELLTSIYKKVIKFFVSTLDSIQQNSNRMAKQEYDELSDKAQDTITISPESVEKSEYKRKTEAESEVYSTCNTFLKQVSLIRHF